MGKNKSHILAILIAFLLSAIYAPVASAQTEVPPGDYKSCYRLENDPSNGCLQCFDRAGDDQIARCKCECKWLPIQDMSYKECVTEMCGVQSGTTGPKIKRGSVFGGQVYNTLAEAFVAAENFIVDQGLEDNVAVVGRSAYQLTENVDSFLVHLVGIAALEGLLDLPVLPNFPNCEEDPSTCPHFYSSKPVCTMGKNQDANPFTAGCQAGIGCLEVPPSVWQAYAGGFCGGQNCCTRADGCSTTTGVTGGPDTTRGNGYYGINSPGCPTGP